MTRDEKIDRAYEYAYRIRKMALDMGLYAGKTGSHIGGGFSCIEILATLYGAILNLDLENPMANNCDRFIPSKAHCVLAYYPALVCTGFLREEDVYSFFDDGGLLAGKPFNPHSGMEYSGGSLGMGLSLGLGKALHAKLNHLSYCTYVLLGDGECNEGSVWEAIMAAGHFRLDNLIAIVDYNHMQNDGPSESIMDLGDLRTKWETFGWYAVEVEGHNIEALYDTFQTSHGQKPLAVIAHTVKANGIPSLENQAKSHYAVMTQEDYDYVIKEMKSGKYDRIY